MTLLFECIASNRVTDQHINQMIPILQLSFPMLQHSDLKYTLKNNGFQLILKHNHHIIGLANVYGNTVQMNLVNFCIHPDFRNKGYAKILMDKIQNYFFNNKNSIVSIYCHEDTKDFYIKSDFHVIKYCNNGIIIKPYYLMYTLW